MFISRLPKNIAFENRLKKEEKKDFYILVQLIGDQTKPADSQKKLFCAADSDLEILSELITLHRQFWCPIYHFLLNYALAFNIYHTAILFIDHVEGIKLLPLF